MTSNQTIKKEDGLVSMTTILLNLTYLAIFFSTAISNCSDPQTNLSNKFAVQRDNNGTGIIRDIPSRIADI